MHYANVELLNMIAPRYEWPRAWDHLTDRWPQLNKRSQIALVERLSHRVMVIPRSMELVFPLRRVPVSGWRRFQRALKRYSLAQLDDPDTRIKYQAGLWTTALTLPLPSLWRFVGRVFRNNRWHERGFEEDDRVYYSTDEIQFEAFGYQDADGLHYAYLAYHVASDTVYVAKGVVIGDL
ncbi:MAG: hypothetical protein JNJ61_04355 [Anaerolineae bacterium]|nr:hypothetical protein [Anaerolineae bacterium]